LKLGNASRAKDPDFWCAFEDGEVTVIGDVRISQKRDSCFSNCRTSVSVSRGQWSEVVFGRLG